MPLLDQARNSYKQQINTIDAKSISGIEISLVFLVLWSFTICQSSIDENADFVLTP